MKKTLSLLLALCLLVSLAGCTGTGNAPGTTGPSAPAYPMTLTDQAGRSVTIPAEPRRIVSSYYISTSALIALGMQDRLVGVEAKADKRPLYGLSAPELLELPWIGTGKELDFEGCLALEPDLVILPMKLKDSAQRLEELGIPALVVYPESLELLSDMMELLSQVTGADQRLQAYRTFAERQEALLSAPVSDRPSVYLGGNSDFLSTAGSRMYQSGLIELAGGRNVADEITDTYWAQISYEQLLAWDPEYIILASDASYSVEDVLQDPNLADCRAVKEGRVFHLPRDAESWDSPVPGAILGALWMASVLGRVTWEDTAAAASEFYEQFYGFQYTLS